MSLGIYCSPLPLGVLPQEWAMGVMQPLTQKTEPQNSSRAADMAQGRRDGDSFPSLCLAVRVLNGCLGQKSPHNLKWCWDKIPDDTQLIVNLVPLHNTTDQSSDQKGFGTAWALGKGGEEDPRKISKGRCRKATVTESLQDTTAVAQKPQPLSVHINRDKLIWTH